MYGFCKMMFVCCKTIVIPQDFPIRLLWKSHTFPPISIFLQEPLGIIVTCLITMSVCCKIMYRYGFITIRENREKACLQRSTVHDCRCGNQKQGVQVSHHKQNIGGDQRNFTTGVTTCHFTAIVDDWVKNGTTCWRQEFDWNPSSLV